MANKVMVIVVVAFAIVLLVAWGPLRDNLIGGVTPQVPKVSAVYVGTQKPSNSTGWQFMVEDRILTDCMVAFLYSFDGRGKLTVYEIDGGTLKALGLDSDVQDCDNGVLRYGVLAVNFTKKPEVLTVEVWLSKSSTERKDVYFKQIGNWRFVNGSYIGYTAPPMDRDYALLGIDEVRELMNRTGIHYISP
ncbi:hypothetical protein [Thermococcus sp. 21S7]|uniref:hypothetical protein n=1 Tax=Thermococcus sp. 21S7 TaxID=1638221 RepID=UPI00143C2417|nr:hypothetical protein [Thermococcus sp. 21S7]NJE60765.1 hypothetical protein [Thermococcus sp. 21S7]